MANIRLKHKATGDIIEKSELNWKNLPFDRKEQYIVLDGDNTASPIRFSPPELTKPVEHKPVVEATPAPTVPEKPAADIPEETSNQKILRLHAGGMEIKEIAKEMGMHWKSVESIVNKASK